MNATATRTGLFTWHVSSTLRTMNDHGERFYSIKIVKVRALTRAGAVGRA